MATYADQAAIMANGAFINRVAVAVAKYAQWIMGNASTQGLHKVQWANNAVRSPISVASQIVSLCIWDGAITGLANGTTDASNLSDAQIQAMTEAVINNYALTWS